jgi:hypothetical protein
MSVINQALIAAGGAAAIGAIADYTAAGIITYHVPSDTQGTVTLRGLGSGEFRMDASLASGVRSEVDNGNAIFKDETGLTKAYPVSMSPGRLVLPAISLVPALTSASLSVLYKGLVQMGGHPAYRIEVQRFLRIPIADPDGHFRDLHTVDYFVDASTFQILMVQDIVPKQATRQISYSNYRSAGGVLVPFSISEQIDGQPTRQIELGQITFNSGLQDSDFQP